MYKLDIISNLITRAPIILALIFLIIIVLLIGIYYNLHKTKELMKINNELLRDIKEKTPLRDDKE